MAIVAVVSAVMILVLLYFDALEVIYRYTREHEHLDIDEFVMFLLVVPLPLAWYSWRRSVEVAEVGGQRLRVERELARIRRLEALGILAGGMAHEINNQLVPVFGMTEVLLSKCPADDPDRRKLELVLAGATRARDTVRKVLAYSRRGQDNRVVSDVSEVIDNMRDVLDLSCPSTVRLSVEVEPGIGVVPVAASDLEGAVVNLVVNAVRAMEGRSGDLVVRAERTLVHNGKGLARITVTDQGRGIDPADLPHIFEPFFTTSSVDKGSGLGLWQVDNMVSASGGRVGVRSKLGQGTTMTIDLPIADVGKT